MVIHAMPMGIATSYLVCDQGMVLVWSRPAGGLSENMALG